MPGLAQIIHKEMAEKGAIPFRRFMELALYCPEYGFYEKEEDRVGRGGDFYTSVSVGPLFGELLAFQFSRWFEAQSAPNLRLIEAGAHNGQLASDVLGWFQRQRPDLLSRLEYCVVEPSARRRDWQRNKLAAFEPVRWVESLTADGLAETQPERGLESASTSPVRNALHPHPNPSADPTLKQRERRAPFTPHASRLTPCFTILFSNELLDAMPVTRLGWDAAKREWFEWGVTAEAGRFAWARLSPVPPSSLLALPSSPELLAILPDGFSFEISFAAEAWWRAAAERANPGKLLTFDYGFESDELIRAERPAGTVRAYRQHKHAEDILSDPGEQDITAHVNFRRLEDAGRAAGLKTERLESQSRFLTRLVAEAWKPESNFGPWDAKRTRQFQTLTHPQHLGQSFSVLIQSP